MNSEHRLLKKIAQTQRGKTYLFPLLASVIVLALAGIWIWTTDFPPSTTRIIALTGLLLALSTFLLVLRTTRKNLRSVAAELDAELNSCNQLETMVELNGSSHPLRTPQAERTERDIGHYNPAPWALWCGIAGLLLCVELCGFTPRIFHFSTDGISAPAEIASTQTKNDFAELELTKPESEIRMKPMDEVAWEGNGRSSNGFDELHLAVFLNGNVATDIPVENPLLKQSGASVIAGSFFLDEIDAEPFDVVSYHLVAHTTINGEKNVEIISIPRFIEVRPFREDAEKSEGNGAEQEKILNFIHQVLEFELILNKAVFAARAAGLPNDNPDFIKQIALLQGDQQRLKQELNTFLADVDPALLTANMLSSLRAAEKHMEAAEKQLAMVVRQNGKSERVNTL